MDKRAHSHRLIVALDVESVDAARALVSKLGGDVTFYKIGLELLFSGGQELARTLVGEGKRIFIDAKLLDIGNTVERAAANIAKLGATFLTVHGHDRKTLDAAVKGRGRSRLKLLAVTVLTSLSRDDLAEQGIDAEPSELVLHRARLAADRGFDGVVASPQEARALREELPDNMLIVTPGVRPKGSVAGDQARVATPAQAMRDGADYIVVGRPITRADDPLRAARDILQEMAIPGRS